MKYIKNFPSLGGVITALITPFKYGAVDYKTLKKLILRQIDHGATAIVLLGTTGEASALTDKERNKIIQTATEISAGRLFIIVGISSADTAKSVEAGKQAAVLGANAVLSLTPYYTRPNQQGLLRHFNTVADALTAPVMLYNVPSRTGVNISPQTAEILFNHENILGLKEAGTDFDDILSKIVCTDSSFVYCGNDLFIPLFASVGCAGCVSVASNVCYRELHSVFSDYTSGNIESGNEKYIRLRPFLKALCTDTNPIPIKSVMADLGLAEPELRLPLTKLSEPQRSLLLTSAVDAGIII